MLKEIFHDSLKMSKFIDGFHSENSEVLRILIYTRLKINKK